MVWKISMSNIKITKVKTRIIVYEFAYAQSDSSKIVEKIGISRDEVNRFIKRSVIEDWMMWPGDLNTGVFEIEES